jgi:hypothetical protein
MNAMSEVSNEKLIKQNKVFFLQINLTLFL